ncbi:MAG: hypothetical protein AB7P02_29430 [Alphaproteobacteria bacterium]
MTQRTLEERVDAAEQQSRAALALVAELAESFAAFAAGRGRDSGASPTTSPGASRAVADAVDQALGNGRTGR